MAQRLFQMIVLWVIAVFSATLRAGDTASQPGGGEMVKMWRVRFYYVGQKSADEKAAWGEFRESSEAGVMANARLAWQVQQAVANPGFGQMAFGAVSKPEEVVVPRNKKFEDTLFPIQNFMDQRYVKIILQTTPQNAVDQQRKADLLAVYHKILQLSARIQIVIDAGPQDNAVQVLSDSILGFNKLPRPSDYEAVATRFLEEEQRRYREEHKAEDDARTRALLDQVWQSYRRNQNQR